MVTLFGIVMVVSSLARPVLAPAAATAFAVVTFVYFAVTGRPSADAAAQGDGRDGR